MKRLSTNSIPRKTAMPGLSPRSFQWRGWSLSSFIPHHSCFERRAATLMEVLMAILIMGIGLVSIASLFPISVLRSVQANYLTFATTHRYNAEQVLKSFPHILRDPDNGDQDGDGNAFNDQRGMSYMIDPLALSQNSPIQGNTVVGQMYRYDGFSQNGASPNPNNIRINNPGDAVADWLATSPDTWKVRYEAIGNNLQTVAGGQTLTVPGLGNQNVYTPNNGTLLVRAVVFNAAGTVSESRILPPASNGNGSTPVGNTISWNTALPGGYTNNVGKVLIQTQAREFTWIMTVRKQFSTSDVTVAVFHNRDLNPIYDIAYANSGNPNDIMGSDQDQNGNQGFRVFHEGLSLAYVTWAQGAQAPYLKKGGWILDTQNGFWYQIEAFVTGTATVGGNTINWASITLDSPAKGSSGPGFGVAVFYKGIVDVFPLAATK